MAKDFSKITIDGTTYNVKVPNSLKVGTKTFDGSSEVIIEAADLGLSNALQFIGETTETPLSDGSKTSSVKIGSTTHTAAIGDVVLYNSKEFVWQGSEWRELGDGSSHALKTVKIEVGGGLKLDKGGTLGSDTKISHADTSSQGKITAVERRYISGVTLDDYGHVIELKTGTETDQDVSGFITSDDSVKSLIDYANADNKIKIGWSGDGISGDNIRYIAGYTFGDGESAVRIKDISKDALKSWLGYAAVATSGAYSDLSGTPANATTSTAGLMSAADKTKINYIEYDSSKKALKFVFE